MKNLLVLVFAGIASAFGQIVVDGSASEWTGTGPVTDNSAVYSSHSAGSAAKVNEWIWRDAAGDYRTDYNTAVVDLLEVRLASDGTNLYYLCRLPPNPGGDRVMLQISVRRQGSSSAQRLLAGFADTMVPENAAWDFLIVTPGGSGGSANKVWAPDFSLANAGTYVQNLTTGTLEGSVPWSALGGKPGALSFLFTFSTYLADAFDNTHDIGGASVSNCLDCVTTTSGNTWNAVSTGSLDYAAPIQFLDDDEVLPIRLASFSATAMGTGDVRLDWTTMSELNNYGVYVERKCNAEPEFLPLPGGFIAGHGTSATQNHYSYTDVHAAPGDNSYRLRQVDMDGTTRFSEEVRARVEGTGRDGMPAGFALFQNYPNPFNPSTIIRYSLQAKSHARLSVFNPLGQRAGTLVNETQEAGVHEVRFDGSGLPSGVYFYRLVAGSNESTMKFILTK